jgi:hypothetical protein
MNIVDCFGEWSDNLASQRDAAMDAIHRDIAHFHRPSRLIARFFADFHCMALRAMNFVPSVLESDTVRC